MFANAHQDHIIIATNAYNVKIINAITVLLINVSSAFQDTIVKV